MPFIPITDFNNENLRPYTERSEKQLLRWNEPELGFFIAESPNVITRALAAGYEPVSFLIEAGQEKKIEEIPFEISSDTPIFVGEHDLLKTMTGYELTTGMLSLMKRKPYISEGGLLQSGRIVVLEDVVNPTNLGAIFRSAAALGMEAVLLTSGCTDPLYRRAARVSMGTVFQIPWTYLPKEDWLRLLQENGYKTVAMALRKNSIDLDDARLLQEPKLAILMGTEGEGLQDATIDASDYVVKIPMAHEVDSLNVAAASAVAFWQLGKR